MSQFKLFNNYNKKKIALIALIILALLFILGKNYISELVKVPSIRIHLINIAKVAIPLKNLILMRSVDDKIALLKTSGSCVFCDLTQGNFSGKDLKGVDLRYAILTGANLNNVNLSKANLNNVNLSNLNLSNANLSHVNLSNFNLSNTNLSHANLSNTNLSNANLSNTNLSHANLNGVTLHKINLSGVNLDGVDLSGIYLYGADLRNTVLTGTILTYANLAESNLDGVDLSNNDLTGVNLSGVDLSNTVLTGTILVEAKKIKISIKNPSNSNWPALNEIQNLNVTRYDLSGDVQYLATKEGFLFESKNNESRLALDLNKDALFPFESACSDCGILGIASQNKLVYVSYSSEDINGLYSLVVDEYSMNFSKVRNIIKIVGFPEGYYGANLLFDSLGKLYLSVGDSGYTNQAQDLNSLKGKILRLDVSKSKLEPEIVAYGIRVPWGVAIDSKDRMFIMQCGHYDVEAVYLLNDLYSGVPANLGWPVFEGSERKRNDPLKFDDILAPIFEYYIRPGCVTGGVYMDDLESFLLGDYYGTIRLLKQQEDGDWYLFHEYKHEEFMNNDEFGRLWGFGLDEKTKKIFVAPDNLELEISVDQVNLNQ